MKKHRLAVVAVSVIASIMLVIPFSFALMPSTVTTDGNQISVYEDSTGGMIVGSGYTPRIVPVLHGDHLAFSIRHKDSDHVVKYGKSEAKTFYLTIPAKTPFCMFVENKEKFYLFGYYEAEIYIKILGTPYEGGSSAVGNYYFSAGNVSGNTMYSVSNFNDVVFMSFEEDTMLEIYAMRRGTIGVEATLKLQIVYG